MSEPVSQQVPNGVTSAGPGWTIYGSAPQLKTLMVWKGEATDTRIFWSTTSALLPDGNSGQYNWTPIQPVPGALTSSSPAIATLKGVPYLVWKGQGTDGSMYWSKFDGNGAWSMPQSVSGAGGTSEGPALVALRDTLYLAWMDENNGTRIFWSTSGDGATTWAPQAAIDGAGTSASPALATDGVNTVYMAWKGEGTDTTVWWAKCNDGRKWTTQQRGPVGAVVGPAIAVDGNKVLWAALTAIEVGQNAIFPVFVGGTSVYFSYLSDESKNRWSPRAEQYLAGSPNRPALIPTGKDSSGLMLAWRALENSTVSYSPLLLPPQVIEFSIPDYIIDNMRTGHAGIKDGSDTVYAGLAAKVKGQPISISTKESGNHTSGEVGVAGLGSALLTIHPGDIVYFHYALINWGAGAPSATSFLEKTANMLLNAVEKADEAAIQSLTGLPLSQLSPQESGALIGAQIGCTIPGVGVILGAIAGWLADDVWGFAFPDCDGPVAAGLYILDAETIRGITAGEGIYIRTDDNPGVNSASGCGNNSHYQVIWNVGLVPR